MVNIKLTYLLTMVMLFDSEFSQTLLMYVAVSRWRHWRTVSM